MFVHGSAATPKEIKDRKITAYENGGKFHLFYRFGSGFMDTCKCNLLSQNVRYSFRNNGKFNNRQGTISQPRLASLMPKITSWLSMEHCDAFFLPFLGDDVN